MMFAVFELGGMAPACIINFLSNEDTLRLAAGFFIDHTGATLRMIDTIGFGTGTFFYIWTGHIVLLTKRDIVFSVYNTGTGCTRFSPKSLLTTLTK
jgi:hypothetical protein